MRNLALLLLGPWVLFAQSKLTPFELADQINAQGVTDWQQIWKAIGAGGKLDYFPPCPPPPAGESCSTELITVTKPSQIILLVEDGWNWDLYFRFLKEPDGWKFAGFYSEDRKYYPRRHEMAQFGGKPFLKVSRQGSSGSDVASEIEDWFDLTEATFKPIFSFTVQGHLFLFSFGISRDIIGTAVWDWRTGGIFLYKEVRFSFDAHDLGEIRCRGVFVRDPASGQLALRSAEVEDRVKAPMPTQDFVALDDFENGPSEEKLLAYALPGLKDLASHGDTETKDSLKELLDHCDDTPEKRAIQALLSARK